MPTFAQLNRIPRKKSVKKCKTYALRFAPQKKGVCVKIYITAPKKPNSAKRKVAQVRLSTKKKVIAYIPGIGHNLQQFAHVLVRGGKVPDLPGLHYTLVRGKYDLQSVLARRNGRSKYGTRWWFGRFKIKILKRAKTREVFKK